jgi:hypothetical protein
MQMKKLLMVGLVIGLSLVLVTSAFAAKQKKAAAPKGSSKAGASAFTGTVSAVNTQSKTMTVTGKQAAVTFDVAKPVFNGYKALGDVKQGDKVAVSYGPDTTKVTKVAAGKPAKAKQPAEKSKKPVQKSKKKKAPKS